MILLSPPKQLFGIGLNLGANGLAVKYLLLEDTDMIIAMQLLMDGIPVTVENINSYRRSLIRQQLYLDSTTSISKGTRRLS